MSNLTQAWLEDQTSIRCLLVEITAKDVIANTEVTFYLSDTGYTTSGTTAAVSYLPYLTGNLQTTESLSIDGGLSMSFGDIQVANLNGELDSWLDSTQYVWVNRRVQVYLGDPRWVCATLATVHSTFEKIFDGVIADVDSSSRESLNVKVRDKLEKLNYPITDAVIGTYGTWAGGQSNQDTIRPLIIGEVNNITPVLVDPSKLEYMFSDTSIVTNIKSTSSTTNELTCTSTLGMIPNKPINFSTIPVGNVAGTILGGLTSDTNKYYVRSITSPTTFTLQLGNGSIATENTGADCLYVGASSYIYLSSRTGFVVGQPVVFYGAGVPTGLVAGTTYYVVTASATVPNAIRVSATSGGSLISLTNTSTTYADSPSAPTWWVTQNIGTAVTLTDTTGNMLAETRASTYTATCTATTASTNIITTSNTTLGFAVNKPIIFSGTVFGNITAGVTYYIKSVVSATTFTISDTLTNNVAGTVLTLATASGTMMAEMVTSGNEAVIEIRDNGVPIYINPSIYTGSSTRPSGALVNNATGKFTLVSPASGTVTASVQGLRQSVNFIDNSPPVFEGNYINNANNLIALVALKYGQANNRLTWPELDITNLSGYSSSTVYTFSTVSTVTHTYVTGTTESMLVLTGTSMDTSSFATGDWVAVSGLSHATLATTVNNAAQILTITATSITLRLPNTITSITAITMITANTVTLTKIDWASVGVAVLDRSNVLNVLRDIAASVGGQVFFNRLGKLQLLKLGTPTTDTVMSITDNDILHHSLHISRRTEVTAATKVGYCLNHTPQTSLASSLPSSANTMFSDQWYSTTVLDSVVQNNYKLDSIAIQKDTKLVAGRDAADLALRLNNYFKVPRTVYAFTGTAKLMYLKLGQGVTLTHNRFGLNSGKSGQVITLAPDWANGTVNVEVII